MLVIYKQSVSLPEYLAGNVGDERELPQHDAERLIDEGYVVRKGDDGTDTGTSTTS